MRGAKALAPAMAACLALVAGCTGPTGGGEEPEESPEPTVVPLANAEAEVPAPPVPSAANGETIEVRTSRSAPSTFDPARLTDPDGLAIMKLVARSLTQYRYSDGDLVLVPDLAIDLGTPNEDFTRWEFKLRDGIRYEDGTEVVAEDLAYGIRRQFAEAELPGGPTHAMAYLEGGAEYAGPFHASEGEGGGEEPAFAGVEATDDRTLVIRLRRPFADLPYLLAHPAFGPVPAEADADGDYERYGRRPTATGPYKFEKHTPGRQLVLTRNDEWNPDTDTTRQQFADRWIFAFGDDRAELQRRVVEGEKDDRYLVVPDAPRSGIVEELGREKIDGRLISGPGRCVSYTTMDTMAIPEEVRRAVAMATPAADVARAADAVPGLTWESTTSLLPPTVNGRLDYDPFGTGGDRSSDEGAEAWNGDHRESKKLLEQAGELGFELSFYYDADSSSATELAEIRREAYERGGFTVNAIGKPSDELAAAWEKNSEGVNLRPTGWCSDWPTPSSVLPVLWDPRRNAAEDGPNPWFAADPDAGGGKGGAKGASKGEEAVDPDMKEVGERIDRASSTGGGDGLLAWGELDQFLMEQLMPAVPTGVELATAFVGGKVGNAHIDATTGLPDYAAMYVEP